MRPISELTHYEVLEIASDAAVGEIERAYRVARAAWATDSLAAYSLYEEREATAIRERVETAWRVLSDPEARGVYDAQLEQEPQEHDVGVQISIALEREDGEDASPDQIRLEVFEDENDAPFDGARLRRARLQRGVDIEQIAEVTKVSPAYLQFIEEERFVDLPAAVYIRGFVSAYARCLGLDPERVAPSYMERVLAAREPEPVRARTRRRGLRRR